MEAEWTAEEEEEETAVQRRADLPVEMYGKEVGRRLGMADLRVTGVGTLAAGRMDRVFGEARISIFQQGASNDENSEKGWTAGISDRAFFLCLTKLH